MMSQVMRIRDRVLAAGRSGALGMAVGTEYVRCRGVAGDEVSPLVVLARWTSVSGGAGLAPGGFFGEGAGRCRVAKDAFVAAGLGPEVSPRRGDLVRWMEPTPGDWWEVKGVADHPLDGEWTLELGAVEG